jgi:chaperonin GroEL
MLENLALITGGKAITEGRDIQLTNIQISDLGQAKKITIDKNNTVVEGRATYDQLSSESEPRSHSNVRTSPLQSSRTHITGGTHGTLSPFWRCGSLCSH